MSCVPESDLRIYCGLLEIHAEAKVRLATNAPHSPINNSLHSGLIETSVPDPWQFGTDLDMWNRTSAFGSRSGSGSGSGSRSCSFCQWPSRYHIFLPSFFAYYFLKIHLHHSSKIKLHKEVTKQWN